MQCSINLLRRQRAGASPRPCCNSQAKVMPARLRPALAASGSTAAAAATANDREAAILSRRALLSTAAGAGVAAAGVQLAAAGAASAAACEFVSSPSGLQFCDVKVGEGPEPVKGSLIRCHYTGRLTNGRVFDSSYERGRPLTFKVGVHEVITGWDLGILGDEGIPAMKAGGKRELLIPAALAYGERGAGGVIPPNSDLLFTVELLGKR